MLKDKGLFEIEQMELIGSLHPRSVYSSKQKEQVPSDPSRIFRHAKCLCEDGLPRVPSIASSRYTNNEGVLRVVRTHNDEHDCVKLVEGLWQAIEKMKL